ELLEKVDNLIIGGGMAYTFLKAQGYEVGTSLLEIDNQVIAQVVYRAAMESYGLVGLAYKSKGIVELLKGENATKGVRVEEVEEDAIAIELYVIIQYGTNISTVANNIIDRVKYVVEKMTGVRVTRIDINVQGIRVK
ncbi:phosphoglycerate kinase family protein, partial [Clostridioides difficile DA00183]|uniref:Asp23/Gls24 family envelope stress response protein n=2 Tax=Clostridioides difficile TaxID=1496 RepID=UPI00038D2236